MAGDHQKAGAIGSLLVSMASVQGGASIAKRLFPVVGAEGATALRIGLSAILLLCMNGASVARLTCRQWKYCILYGITLGSMNLIFYHAIQHIPIGLAVAVEFTGPLALAIFYSRKMTDIIWAVLAAGGILLIVPWGTHGVDLAGLACALLAGGFWACYILVGGRISTVMGKRDAVTGGLCVAAVMTVPVGLASGLLHAMNLNLLAMGLGLAVLSSAVPYSLELFVLGKLPAKTFGILMSLQPVFGALSGMMFLGEILTSVQWLSIACIIAASVGAAATSPVEKG